MVSDVGGMREGSREWGEYFEKSWRGGRAVASWSERMRSSARRLGVQITKRDEAVLAWLGRVRVADMDAVREALRIFGDGKVQSARLGQRWCGRMEQAGCIRRFYPWVNAPAVLWLTFKGAGAPEPAPNPASQTLRHDLEVARLSLRYIEQGWTWERPGTEYRPGSPGRREHIADGVAVREDGDQRVAVAVEVELTAKSPDRLQDIMRAHARRIESGETAAVHYFVTPAAGRAVQRARDAAVVVSLRPAITIQVAFDDVGRAL